MQIECIMGMTQDPNSANPGLKPHKSNLKLYLEEVVTVIIFYYTEPEI